MTEAEKYIIEIHPNIPDDKLAMFRDIGVFTFAENFAKERVKEALEEVKNSLPSKAEILEISGTDRKFIMGAEWMKDKIKVVIINK